MLINKTKILKSIPNALTFTSLFMGFSSILASIQALKELLIHNQNVIKALDKTHSTLSDVVNYMEPPNPEKYLAYSGIFIMLGIFFDMFDGIFARLLNAHSKIGKQLDSMSDLITFGLAPGVMFYTLTLFAGQSIPDSGIVYNIAKIIPDFFLTNLMFIKLLAFLFPICAVYRLARFNETEPADYFIGLPSTYAGGMTATVFTFNFYTTPFTWLLEKFSLVPPELADPLINGSVWVFKNFLFLLIVYVVLGLLMVSNIPFPKFNYFYRNLRGKKVVVPMLMFALSIIFFFKYALAVYGLFYIIHGTT